MASITLEELKYVVQEYVDTTKIANTSFTATANNIVGLLDKIGLIITLDTSFIDKLSELDGTDLPFGKTIEEWYQDLIAPVDYDPTGAGALKWYSPTYRPVAYSYTVGRKTIPISIPNNNIERAVNNAEQYGNILFTETKRLEDSYAQFRYAAKRQLMGTVTDMTIANLEGAISYVASSTKITEGQYYTDGTDVAVAMQSASASASTFAQLVQNGTLVVIKIIQKLAIPTDTATGEAFITAVKEGVEKASDVSEGYSWNGNAIGADMGLSLYVKQGVMPNLEVQTLAGAFHLDKMGMGVTAKVIKDFGVNTSKVYAILCDSRAFRLHRTYDAVRENFNGDGDFLNMFRHTENTAFFSRNAFIMIFVEPEA